MLDGRKQNERESALGSNLCINVIHIDIMSQLENIFLLIGNALQSAPAIFQSTLAISNFGRVRMFVGNELIGELADDNDLDKSN